MSGMLCVQTVCKGYQQTARVRASKKRVKFCSYVVVLDACICIFNSVCLLGSCQNQLFQKTFQEYHQSVK